MFPAADTSDFAGSVRCDAVGEELFSAVALEMDPGNRIFTTLPKNPIRVMAVVGWGLVQGLVLLGWAVLRAGRFVAGLPAPVLFFFAGLWYAVWSFVRRPFPSLDENPLLALMNYHTPNFFGWVVLWYYVSPFVVVMLSGLIALTVWKVWLEGRRRDFAPFAKLPPWPLDPKQKAPAIVIGEVHHPVEAREIFSPSWLTIPERGLYTGVAIFGAVGSGKTSACMNPFARQLLGWQAANPQLRAAALVLEVKGDFCHDIRQILVEAGRGQDYIELGMDSFPGEPLSGSGGAIGFAASLFSLLFDPLPTTPPHCPTHVRLPVSNPVTDNSPSLSDRGPSSCL